ncbi:MAG: RT0821/Lpp0805 family surface protein [Rhodospirillaceae bacterium]|jgi:surface antigen
MKVNYLVAFLGISLISLSGCVSTGDGQKQGIGSVMGAAVGGLLGSKVGGGQGKLAATAIGAVTGFLIGGEIGKSLDKADKIFAAQTANRALENNRSGETSSWSNPDSGHSGTFTPTRTTHTRARHGKDCREYEQTITVDGRSEKATGIACRRRDGTWKIAS